MARCRAEGHRWQCLLSRVRMSTKNRRLFRSGEWARKVGSFSSWRKVNRKGSRTLRPRACLWIGRGGQRFPLCPTHLFQTSGGGASVLETLDQFPSTLPKHRPTSPIMMTEEARHFPKKGAVPILKATKEWCLPGRDPHPNYDSNE